jgi:uncharacterized protein (DUF4415 family)
MARAKRVARVKKVARARSGSRAAGPKARRGGSISLMAAAEERDIFSLSTEQYLAIYRPLKKPVTMRLDADVIAWFKKPGRRYQTRINRALRKVMMDEMKAAKKSKGG